MTDSSHGEWDKATQRYEDGCKSGDTHLTFDLEGPAERSTRYFDSRRLMGSRSAVTEYYATASAADVPGLIACVRALQSRLEITDEMVERAARASFEHGTEDWTWDDVLREEADRAEYWRADARIILEAALSPDEI